MNNYNINIFFNQGNSFIFSNNIKNNEDFYSINNEERDNSFDNISLPFLRESNFFGENINNIFTIPKENIVNAFDTKSKTFFKTVKEIPKPLSENDINIKIKQMNLSKEDKIKYNLEILNPSDKICKIKEKLMKNQNGRRKKTKKKKIGKEQNTEKVKYGRKANKDNNDNNDNNDASTRKEAHDKYFQDNIIDKIKNMINHSLVLFCNKIIRAIYEDKNKINDLFSCVKFGKEVSRTKIIKDIDHSFIKSKKKGIDILNLLNMTIKEYLCNNISSKYEHIPPDYNKLIINQLFLDNNNKKIYNFIFNHLKIENWLNIFIYQEKLKDVYEYELLNNNEQKIIKDNLVRINDYFEGIYRRKDGEGKIYFHCFMIMIYNLKRFLMIKERRNSNKKKNNF